MKSTVENVFEVVSIQEKDICLRTVHSGLTVFVEKRDYFYDEEMRNEIDKLSENDIVRIVLKSQNNMNTIWHISSIEEDV